MVEELAHYMAYVNPGLGGEFLAYMAMEGQVPSCRCLWDLTIPKAKGDTQVDLLLIHATGIYVVESKNYSNCRIQGDEKLKDWTAFYKQGKDRGYLLYNPHMQNEGHIAALKCYVDYPVPMISIVAYSNQCALEIKRKPGSKTIHCHYGKLGNIMRASAKFRKPCLDNEEVWLLYQLLRPLASSR